MVGYNNNCEIKNITDIINESFDPNLGQITPENSEEVITPEGLLKVYDDKFMGIECTKGEKYNGIGTGVVCGAITGD